MNRLEKYRHLVEDEKWDSLFVRRGTSSVYGAYLISKGSKVYLGEYTREYGSKLPDLKEERTRLGFINKCREYGVIDHLLEKGYRFELVGGAVLDIISEESNVFPRDYDFLSLSEEFLKECKFIDTSSTADTYMFVSHKIQVLKTKKEDFDFTISQATLEYENTGFEFLSSPRGSNGIKLTGLCEKSYNSKILIPVNYSRSGARNSLRRIPHWNRKGYKVTDVTYQSLLSAAFSQPRSETDDRRVTS